MSLLVAFILALVLSCSGTGNRQTSDAGFGNVNILIDSVSVTPTTSGKYSLASEFFEKLAALKQAEGADSAQSVLLTFFSHLHPKIRVTDWLAVLQTVEWIYNCFTQMDSGGVFYTNGAADTYAAWYLQQVEGIRPDLTVISLQFLVGSDYRQFLLNDTHIRSALSLSEEDTLPVPPSTGATQDALVEIVTRQVSNAVHPPVYMAPRCGVAERFGGHIVDLGLVHAYQDSIQPQNHTLDLLISNLTQDWRLRYASEGAPKDSSYAARATWLQYLTLVIRMALEFEEQKHYQNMDTLFTYLEPVVSDDWRFSFSEFTPPLHSWKTSDGSFHHREATARRGQRRFLKKLKIRKDFA
jgi:hypothetical protein